MYELLQVGVPAVAVLQHGLAEEKGEVHVDLPAVGLDAPVRPFSGEAEFPPGPEVPRPAPVLGSENGIELRQGQPFDGIVLTHKNHVRVIEIVHVEAAGGDLDAGWGVMLFAQKCRLRRGADLLAQDGNVSRPGVERTDRRGGAIHVVLEFHVRLVFRKTGDPRVHQPAHEVVFRTAVPPEPDRATDVTNRRVKRQGVHEGHLGCAGIADRETGDRQQGAQ